MKPTNGVPVNRNTCSVKGCRKQSVAYCIFAGERKKKGALPKWKGFICEDHFGEYHTKYVGG